MLCFGWLCSQWVHGIFLAHFPDFMKEMVWLKKGWNRRSSAGLRWICQEIWCGSCCHFNIDWCQRWIWVKATTAILFLLWSLFKQWLDFLWRYKLISQDHCGMLSHRMLSFFHETHMLYNSNNWNLFLNFIIYWLWGHLWILITSSRVSMLPSTKHPWWKLHFWPAWG